LRDIEVTLSANASKLYAMGEPVLNSVFEA